MRARGSRWCQKGQRPARSASVLVHLGRGGWGSTSLGCGLAVRLALDRLAAMLRPAVAADGEGGVVAVDPAGRVALVFNTPGMYRASIDAAGHKVVGIYGEDEAP